jgi:hypothetical protein
MGEGRAGCTRYLSMEDMLNGPPSEPRGPAQAQAPLQHYPARPLQYFGQYQGFTPEPPRHQQQAPAPAWTSGYAFGTEPRPATYASVAAPSSSYANTNHMNYPGPVPPNQPGPDLQLPPPPYMQGVNDYPGRESYVTHPLSWENYMYACKLCFSPLLSFISS